MSDEAPTMSDEAAALISRLTDINFEFVKGTGRWPSGKEISPPNLELIRESARQATEHADALILDYERVVQQRDELLKSVNELFTAVATNNQIISDTAELLHSVLYQACPTADEADLDPLPGQPTTSDWFDTSAITIWREVGDWLVEHAGWERHPVGRGRRFFYRPPSEEETG